jgi:hypothetical protein
MKSKVTNSKVASASGGLAAAQLPSKPMKAPVVAPGGKGNKGKGKGAAKRAAPAASQARSAPLAWTSTAALNVAFLNRRTTSDEESESD